MKNRILQFRMMAKVVMTGLLLEIAGITNSFAQDFHIYNGEYLLQYSINYGTTTVTVYSYYGGNNTSLTIPSTVTHNDVEYTVTRIGDNAFSDQYTNNTNDALISIIIPKTVTEIGSWTFQGCTNLADLTLPETLTSIGYYAFYDCNTLTSFTIPESVTTIGEEAFYGTEWYDNQDNGVLYIDNCCLGYKEEQPTDVLIIQNGTRLIAAGAFRECYSLSSVVIPNSVTHIGSFAFFCTSINEVTLSNSLVSIEDNVFNSCNFLNTIDIPNSVTSIGMGAFSNCINLTNANIPNGVTYIGRDAFMFTNLNSITLPSSLQTIGGCAFSGCFNLEGSLVIPDAVVTIEEEAFYLCSGLTSLVLGNSLQTIELRAFESCSGLTNTLFIPQSVSQIGENAFLGCINLSGIVVESENSVYDSRDNCNAIIETATNTLVIGCNNSIISNTVTTIGESAFVGCTFSNIHIPNSVTSIETFAFNGCTNLSSIKIPNSVTFIGRGAFFGCNNLISFIFPNSIVLIGSYVLGNSIESLTILATTPPTLMNWYGYSSFSDLNKSIPVYVPYGTISAYQAAPGWNEFTNYQEITYKSVSGYAGSNGNWQFIASPLTGNIAPTEINDMLPTTGTYDLYRFDQSEDAEWRNYKANNFNLVNGQGYLYANAEDVNIIFKGEFNEDETKEVNLVYDAGMPLAGWNLVGNPFPVNAYANRSYYVMNQDGTAIEPVAVSMETAIPVCTGVMVKADNAGETVTFSKTMPEMVPNQGNIQIAVMQTNKSGVSMMDKAIVSFNAGDKLEKFVFNEDNAQLYIPNGNTNYAIVCAKKTGEMPLNFKAHKNDIYTLTVDTEKTEMEYLHLIDNLTGNDVDLLAEPNYTFEARPTDYASRFKLVFSANEEDGASTGSETFAFVNNGNIIITTDAFDASLQVIDMLGRVLVCRDALRASAISTTGMPPGVYVLRLISGDEVKTQKIVVR